MIRKKTTTEEKKLKGTYRKDREMGVIPNIPIVKSTEAPDFLSPVAKSEWNRIFPHLAEANLITETDIMLLAMYCQEVSVYWDCMQKIGDKGLTYDTQSGTKKTRSEYMIANQALKSIIAIATRYGFSPYDRTKMMITQPVGDSDPVADLI